MMDEDAAQRVQAGLNNAIASRPGGGRGRRRSLVTATPVVVNQPAQPACCQPTDPVMLGRRSSPASRVRNSITDAITDLISGDGLHQTVQVESETSRMEQAIRLNCLLSMITTCLNTPYTIQFWPALFYVLFILDSLITLLFTMEALNKLRQIGMFQRDGYLSGRWHRFELCLLVLHWASLMLHGYQMMDRWLPGWHLHYQDWYGVIRTPRPLIMLRFIRSVVRFKLPKNRIQQIIKRSSQQIQNVTIFFVFFMILYAIMGVQFFGKMSHHCVLPGTDPKNVTIADLAIPDTMCSMKGGGGYECPEHMVCMKLEMKSKTIGYYGMFNDFASSLFTVYMAASQEGWVYILYDCLDSFPSWLAFIYFVTLIFFLAWLVKNVFIAVITETFAEIRVQFSEMWQKRQTVAQEGFKQKLEKSGRVWKLITVDIGKDVASSTSSRLYRAIRSSVFQIAMMMLVLANAMINASFIYRHDRTDMERKQYYYYLELAFTVLFNLECAIKIVAFGWRSFIGRGQHKFELLLCIGSTFNVIRPLYGSNFFTYFQVFRIIRLIKASPMLEDFVYKIFGPGKKLGGLVVFTMFVLVITSAVSLQLFCYVPELDKFRTFPQAFMSMFQIITQEGWTDVVVEILRTTDDRMVPFVAAYFVAYHLFVTLIVLSLFVAVILDNLEMDEQLKKVKQLKAREQTTCMRTTLPWRLRIFDKFPTRPPMTNLKRMPNEFPLPKMRQSFTRQFADDAVDTGGDNELQILEANKSRSLLHNAAHIRAVTRALRIRHTSEMSTQMTMVNLLQGSNRSTLETDGVTILYGSGRGRKQPLKWRRGGMNANASSRIFDHMKENGDIASDSASKKEPKTGEIDIKALQQKRHLAEITRNRIEEEMRENHPYFDSPLFAVGRDSQMRKICRRIVDAKYTVDLIDATTGKSLQRRYKQIHELLGLMPYLDWTMVLITSCSCYSMLFEGPWPTNGENLIFNNPYLQITEYIFVLTMTFELAVKILADGLFFTPKAFVKDVGGAMTVFIYLTSFIYLIWMPRHVEINSFAQLLMIFRAMRPLRIYTLVPHIRRVVVELCKGFKEILLVTVLLVVLMFIFASFGVQIVGGKLAACNDRSIKTKENCTGIFMQKLFVTRLEVYGKNDDELHPQIMVPRVWTNPRNFNFDHIGNAMLALFEALSYKGWNVLRDILWLRQGPWAVLFVHIYVFMGCMIGLTLFVGVVVANYTENRGTALLTVDQRRWHDLKARLKMAQPLHVPPKPGESAKLRNKLYDIILGKFFKQTFAILVILNSFTLIVPWNTAEENERPLVLLVLTIASAGSCMLFAVEILLKMVAFTAAGFWQSRRNRIDFLITVLGLVWIVAHFFLAMPAEQFGGKDQQLKKYTYTFGYLVVIMRFFTIAGRKSTLKMLMLTVVMSMFRSFFIITALFLLVLFYAYAGVVLFGTLKYGQAVSKHVNFRLGSEALVVLFRSVTGEDWNDIMHDCMRSPPFCFWRPGLSAWQTDCGNYYGAIVYFCSFYVIITYIVLNLLVAIIMENFSLFYSSEEDALLSYADIRNFQQVWNMVDIDQRRSIPIRRVKFLLRLLKGRLEVNPNKDRMLFKHMCYEMERLHNGDDVSFHDVLNMLSYRSVDIRKSLQLEELLQREDLEYTIEEEVAKHTIRRWLEACLRRLKAQQKNQKSKENIPIAGPVQPQQQPHHYHHPPPMAMLQHSETFDQNLIRDHDNEEFFIAKLRRGSGPDSLQFQQSVISLNRFVHVQETAQRLRTGSFASGIHLPSPPVAGPSTDRPLGVDAGARMRPPPLGRINLKSMQKPTHDLPDVVEWTEETPTSDLRAQNNDEDFMISGLLAEKNSPEKLAFVDATPEIRSWWDSTNDDDHWSTSFDRVSN